MVRSIKRGFTVVMAVAVAFFVYSHKDVQQALLKQTHVQTAHAGTITAASVGLSSTTESATAVTYTFNWTTATAMPKNSSADIEVRSSSPNGQGPKFDTAAIDATSSAGFRALTPRIFGGGNGVTISVFNSGDAIAAGAQKLVLTGITNPSSGGVYMVNISTNNGPTSIDGQRGSPNPVATFTVGTIKVTAVVTIAGTTTPIKGVQLEVHSAPGSTSNFYVSGTTSAAGTVSFPGLPDGPAVLEKSQNFDPNNSDAAAAAKYGRFDPRTITVSATPQTVAISLAESKKTLTGKVVRKGTTTAVKQPQVGAGSPNGGFQNTQGGTDGTFTLKMNVDPGKGGGMVFVQIMPQMQPNQPPPGGGPGGGTPPVSTADMDFGSVSVQASFVKPASETEVIDLGNIEVPTADATVTFTLQNPDGTASNGGAGLENSREHSFTPVMLDSTGKGSAKVVSGSLMRIQSFDPTGLYAMPATSQFTAVKGTNALGTIKKVTKDKKIVISAKTRNNGVEALLSSGMAMAFDPSNPGPPDFATVTNGVATINTVAGTRMVMVNPNGQFGGGPQNDGGGGGGGDKGKTGMLDTLRDYALGALKFEHASAAATIAVSAPSDNKNLFPITAPQKVTIASTDTTVTPSTFFFGSPDATFNVRTEKAGTLVTDGAFADMSTASGIHMGCPIAGGVASNCPGFLNVASTLHVMYPPNSQYAGKSTTFTLTAASGTVVKAAVLEKTVTLSGHVVNAADKSVVTGVNDLGVGAMSEAGFTMGQANSTDGSYSMKLAPGIDYTIGAVAGRPDVAPVKNGYVLSISPGVVNGADAATVTKDIELKKLDAEISGTVVDNTGAVVKNQTIVADQGLAALIGPGGPGGPGPGGPGPRPEDGILAGYTGTTDDTGSFTIPVPPGTFNLVVKSLKEQGLYDTDVHQVTVASGKTSTGNKITLAKADSTISVEVNKADGTDLTDSTLHIFNENGTVSTSIKDSDDGKTDGVFKANMPAGKYNIQAGEDFANTGKVEKTAFKSVVAQKDATVSTTLVSANQDNAIGGLVSTDVSSTGSAALNVTNGKDTAAVVTIGASTFSSGSSSSSDSSSSSSSSSSSTTVTVAPENGVLPQTKLVQTVGSGINISANSNGNDAQPSSPVPVEIHYKDSDVPKGVSEANMKLSYFSEQSGQYVALDNVSVNTTTNTITGTTTHFTDFAITATADTTAAAAPTSITATAKANVTIGLAWTNPTDSDFASVNIYRSTTSGTLGDKVYSAVTGTTKDDTGLTAGTTYYYTITSLDTAGNESPTGVSQVSAKAAAGALPKTGTVFSNGFISPAKSGNFFGSLMKAMRNVR